MCVVSNIGDGYGSTFPQRWPQSPIQPGTTTIIQGEVSKKDFDALKKEVQELKKLLQAAKAFDEATGQKDCEMEDKVRFIRELADYLEVDLEDVFE